jgi:hypothetical protein
MAYVIGYKRVPDPPANIIPFIYLFFILFIFQCKFNEKDFFLLLKYKKAAENSTA